MRMRTVQWRALGRGRCVSPRIVYFESRLALRLGRLKGDVGRRGAGCAARGQRRRDHPGIQGSWRALYRRYKYNRIFGIP
ncbi:hypothetical protein EVAR_33446_1 [Eumeta japonica]|uniref:Uncharacterized protein n=1 Tax=Eumeta variegata TaxID=151549 RepID=A0A4C1W4L2_EUMVA|nr:hypothetical protein EVAR_33446_1 [Eumeta japonica]